MRRGTPCGGAPRSARAARIATRRRLPSGSAASRGIPTSRGSTCGSCRRSRQFPTSAERFYLAYAESVSAVAFLVRENGEEALVRLIQTYADGVSDDEAFLAVNNRAFRWHPDQSGWTVDDLRRWAAQSAPIS